MDAKHDSHLPVAEKLDFLAFIALGVDEQRLDLGKRNVGPEQEQALRRPASAHGNEFLFGVFRPDHGFDRHHRLFVEDVDVHARRIPHQEPVLGASG